MENGVNLQTQLNSENQFLTLLVDGVQAFPEIIKEIENAKKSININMFIWRADNIGLKIATAVYNSAERGVKVNISVDRYGFVLEKAEESTHSFFHDKPTFSEYLTSYALCKFYNTKAVEFNSLDEARALKDKMLSHPNITVEKDRFKADHSKYYLIDGKVLFMGGINIEDKENGCDYLGRVYQDYMVKITDNRLIDGFLQKINGKNVENKTPFLGMNLKAGKLRCFEMEELYLNLIKDSKEYLNITMAYFSPMKKFIKEIVNACNRGVKVSLVLPKSANFQNDANMKTAKRLLKLTNGKVQVFLSPKMLHTKLVFSEKTISLGSTNINKKAFRQLDELNLFVDNNGNKFCNSLIDAYNENKDISNIVTASQIKYSLVRAFIETLVM